MKYEQNSEGGQQLLSSPRCFECDGVYREFGEGPVDWKAKKLEFVGDILPWRGYDRRSGPVD